MPGSEEGRRTARFMAALTHAFRSRLNAVLGSLELVSQTELNADQTRFAATAVDEGRALLQLVNDALDLARIDAADLRLEDAPVDPVAIAEGALGTVAARLHERGIAVASMIDPETPVALRGDGPRLRQVLVNLLDNARKATEHGSVLLSVRPLPGDTSGERLLFEISDTGRGVAEALRERLFEPFVPAGGRADWRYTSLGIGLALCRRLVEMMGGRIEYAARRGGGSIFRFDVRFRRDAEFERLADVVAEARDRSVLMVDGDPVRRASFGEQVQGWGIKVRVVADGAAALPLLKQRNVYDLLLVHQDAPDADRALAAAGATRAAVLVPTGMQPRLGLCSEPERLLWLSAPMRRRTFIDALLGHVVPSVDLSEMPQQSATTERARVLVVEDSDANRMVMTARLERMGCTVDAVATGSEAVRLVSQRRYGLVLVDLSLPDMSGLDVATAIRQLGGEPGKVPIVAVTGGTHPRDRERCLAAGMNDYLSKPLEQRDLNRVLERFLPRRLAQDSVWEPAEIERMGADLGRDRAIELLAAFERELGQRLQRIESETVLEKIGREAHALKSAALAFGAEKLGQTARELERLARQGEVQEARICTRELLTLGRRTHEAIQHWMQQQEKST